MAKIKEVSSYNGTSWDTPVPIGANDANIDITSSTTNPTDTTATSAGLVDSNVTVVSGDTAASAWTKFNRFRKRVQNAFGHFAGVTLRTAYNTSNTDTSVYTTGVINNYMSNVIGYTGTTEPSAGTVAAQLSSLNSNITKDNLSAKIFNDSNNVISNLNSCVPGANFYNINTVNIPVANTYGTCYDLRSGSWHTQVALSNDGKIFIRCYTTSWSSWESINKLEFGTITSNIFSNTSTYSGSYLVKQGKIVNLNITTNATQTQINKNYAERLFNIPTGFRPATTIFAPCVYYINADILTFTLASINSLGEIGFFTPENGRKIAYIRLITTYIVL